MEATDNFRAVLKAYLDDKASKDELFAKEYSNEKKSLSECVQFILGEVRKSGKCALSDDEVYGMAIHYYDEENLVIEDPASVKIVCPSSVIDLDEKEKEEAKRIAIRQYQEELRSYMLKNAMDKKSKNKAKKKSKPTNQPTLF